MIEYNCCPNCGENETKSGIVNLAVRQCKHCQKLQCSECGKGEVRKCINCGSGSLDVIGFIRNKNF